MRKQLFILFVLVCTIDFTTPVLAAAVPHPAADETRVTAVINGPSDIQVRRTLILDGSASHVTGELTSYRWSIDETRQTIGHNPVTIYTPEKSGKLTFRLTVRSANLSGQTEEAVTVHPVVVFNRKIVLITDDTVSEEKIRNVVKSAMDSGVYVHDVESGPETVSVSVEESLYNKLIDEKGLLNGADSIVIWGQGVDGLQALMRSIDGNAANQSLVRYQTVVLITDQNLSLVSRTARSAFSKLKPAQIIITRDDALSTLIELPTILDFRSTLEHRTVPYALLTAANMSGLPWDVLSMLINFMLANGVTIKTILLLLMLPVIATIFAFLKQVIGITTFGLYTPSVVALSFMAIGWKIGLLFLLFILIGGYLTRAFMRRWRLLYIPKVAIILTVVCFTLLILVAAATFFGISFSRDTVFILLILSTLAENFINLKIEEGWWSAFFGVFETVLGAILCVFMVQWPSFQTLILAYPELLVFTILINVLLGRWTGLRLVEYIRFHEVIKHLQEEE